MKKRSLLLLLLPALLLAAGCGDDDDPANPVDGRDGTMADFETVYSEMEYDHLTGLLHSQFQLIPLATTRDAWGWAADYNVSRALFATAHGHLFEGDTGRDALGNPVHPIAEIDIDLMEQFTPWTDVAPDDPDFGDVENAKWATYSLIIQFYNDDRSHQFEIQQQAVFTWAPDPDDGGALRLLGIRVLQPEKSTDPLGWDMLISYYL